MFGIVSASSGKGDLIGKLMHAASLWHTERQSEQDSDHEQPSLTIAIYTSPPILALALPPIRSRQTMISIR